MHPKEKSLNIQENFEERLYQIKTKNKSQRRNIIRKKQESRQFFVCDTYNCENFRRQYDTSMNY